MEQPVRQTRPIRMTSGEREEFLRGRSCLERGELEAAMESFTRLLATHDGYADVHYMVGLIHDRLGDLEAAGVSFQTAVGLNPSYAEALLALATVCERQGNFDRSRELAERASLVSRGAPGALDATTRGKLANLQAELGDAFREAGELREAIEAYRKALDRCPEFHDIRFRLGVALREAGLPDRAMRELARVLRANPEYLDAQVQLGLTYYSLGRSSDALDQWRAVLVRDPSRDDARMYGRLVEAGRPLGAG